MLKKDKEKVLGEVFDDERVKSFLDYLPPAGVDRDFHLLEKAYRGMNIDNFETFLNYFREAATTSTPPTRMAKPLRRSPANTAMATTMSKP